MLSYFKRWLSVFVSAKSFTATTAMDGWFSNNLKRLRPMRPKPFMPTVFGDGKVAQFTTHSYPHTGFYILIIVSILSILASGGRMH